MKKKFKVTLVVFLVVILGCFSETFAATKVGTKLKKNVQFSMNKNLLDSGVTDDGAEIGTGNLNGTAENSAQYGYKLLKPEIGWKRYDDNNNKIKYSQNFILQTNLSNGFYLNTRHHAFGKSNYTFKFVGTQFRIIADKWIYTKNLRTTDCKVTIDGKEELVKYPQRIDPSGNSLAGAVLMYNSSVLSNGIHTVEVRSDDTDTTRAFALDAIDIDSTGYLIDPSANLATGMSLNKTTDLLTVGQPDTLIATVTPDNAANKTVKWISSDPTIVSVDENGNIKALKKGTATITAATTDGSNLSASCEVNVIDNSRCTLTINMVNGSVKQYDLSASELNSFLNWYNGMTNPLSSQCYIFNVPVLGPYVTNKDYIPFNKIDDFKIQEYIKQ